MDGHPIKRLLAIPWRTPLEAVRPLVRPLLTLRWERSFRVFQ